MKKGNIILYRIKLRISLKYEDWKTDLGWKVPKGDAAEPSAEANRYH